MDKLIPLCTCKMTAYDSLPQVVRDALKEMSEGTYEAVELLGRGFSAGHVALILRCRADHERQSEREEMESAAQSE